MADVSTAEALADRGGFGHERLHPLDGHTGIGNPVVEPGHQRRLAGDRQQPWVLDPPGQTRVELPVERLS